MRNYNFLGEMPITGTHPRGKAGRPAQPRDGELRGNSGTRVVGRTLLQAALTTIYIDVGGRTRSAVDASMRATDGVAPQRWRARPGLAVPVGNMNGRQIWRPWGISISVTQYW